VTTRLRRRSITSTSVCNVADLYLKDRDLLSNWHASIVCRRRVRPSLPTRRSKRSTM
jgi:hypothetical protein